MEKRDSSISKDCYEGIEFDFWKWFTKGNNVKPGYRKIFDSWFKYHIIIATIISLFVDKNIPDASSGIILPLSGIFVAICVGYSANISSLFDSKEIGILANYYAEGLVGYVYTYQMSILIILVALVGWGLAGLNFFNLLTAYFVTNFCIEIILYLLLSLSIRETWHLVLSSQNFLLAKKKVQKLLNNR